MKKPKYTVVRYVARPKVSRGDGVSFAETTQGFKFMSGDDVSFMSGDDFQLMEE